MQTLSLATAGCLWPFQVQSSNFSHKFSPGSRPSRSPTCSDERVRLHDFNMAFRVSCCQAEWLCHYAVQKQFQAVGTFKNSMTRQKDLGKKNSGLSKQFQSSKKQLAIFVIQLSLWLTSHSQFALPRTGTKVVSILSGVTDILLESTVPTELWTSLGHEHWKLYYTWLKFGISNGL